MRRGPRVAWACLLLFVAMLGGAPPAAAGSDALVLEGRGWVVADFYAEGNLTLELTFEDEPGGAAAAAFVYARDDPGNRGALTSGSVGDSNTHVVVSHSLAGYHERRGQGADGPLPPIVTNEGPIPSGAYRVVFWTAGAVERAELRITTDTEPSLVEVARGERTWYVRPTDLAYEEGTVLYRKGGYAAALNARGALEFDVQGTLLGWAGDDARSPTYEENFRVDTPTGTHECPCYWPHAEGSWAQGPGRYVLHYDAHGATWGQTRFMIAADVVFPK